VDRYRITLTPEGARFGILDREQYDYCGLPDEDGRAKRLEFKLKPEAEHWLTTCYRTWEAWEKTGEGEPPEGWRPAPAEVSPFDRGWQYYN